MITNLGGCMFSLILTCIHYMYVLSANEILDYKFNWLQILEIYLLEDGLAYLSHYSSHFPKSFVRLVIPPLHNHHTHHINNISLYNYLFVWDTIFRSMLITYFVYDLSGMVLGFISALYSQIFIHILLIHILKIYPLYDYHIIHHTINKKYNLGACN